MAKEIEKEEALFKLPENSCITFKQVKFVLNEFIFLVVGSVLLSEALVGKLFSRIVSFNLLIFELL